jgi:DNA-binding XRE family transcriptional regulator
VIPDPFVVPATIEEVAVDNAIIAPSDIVLAQQLVHRNLHHTLPNFARNIAQARRSMGMTQAELAATVNLTRGSITNLEGQKQGVSLQALYRIAAALEVEVCDLLNG